MPGFCFRIYVIHETIIGLLSVGGFKNEKLFDLLRLIMTVASNSVMRLILPDVAATAKMIQTVVTGLNPYTQYKFRAFGVNIYGDGRPSKESREYSAALTCNMLTFQL